jgi:small subunit ribosomal protein S16
MAVHIRLARHGSKKNPYYRIVVTDQRNARDGRFLENIGTYDPGANPGLLKVDAARFQYWTKQGAQPSHTVECLLKRQVTTPVGA